MPFKRFIYFLMHSLIIFSSSNELFGCKAEGFRIIWWDHTSFFVLFVRVFWCSLLFREINTLVLFFIFLWYICSSSSILSYYNSLYYFEAHDFTVHNRIGRIPEPFAHFHLFIVQWFIIIEELGLRGLWPYWRMHELLLIFINWSYCNL